MSTQQYPEHILKQADEMAEKLAGAFGRNHVKHEYSDVELINKELNLPALLMAKERHDLWKEHAAESDKEFLQLEDWLIGNKEIDLKTGLIDRANKCKERIRDLVASEAELVEVKEQLSQHQQVMKQLVEALEEAKDMVDMLLVIPGATRPAQEGSPAFKIESALSTAKQLLEKRA